MTIGLSQYKATFVWQKDSHYEYSDGNYEVDNPIDQCNDVITGTGAILGSQGLF